MPRNTGDKISLIRQTLIENGPLSKKDLVGKLVASGNNVAASTYYRLLDPERLKNFGIVCRGANKFDQIWSVDEELPVPSSVVNNSSVLGSAELDNLVLSKVKALRDDYIKIGRGDAARFNNNVLDSVNQVPTIEEWREALDHIEKMSKPEQQMMFLRIALTTIKE